jgi:hypothetical protein
MYEIMQFCVQVRPMKVDGSRQRPHVISARIKKVHRSSFHKICIKNSSQVGRQSSLAG